MNSFWEHRFHLRPDISLRRFQNSEYRCGLFEIRRPPSPPHPGSFVAGSALASPKGSLHASSSHMNSFWVYGSDLKPDIGPQRFQNSEYRCGPFEIRRPPSPPHPGCFGAGRALASSKGSLDPSLSHMNSFWEYRFHLRPDIGL
ncbi:hypothetical protein FGB62_66g127 [Gracilaria domingensis]|nr:hypothetical protein FGB62_66g127 [Gracilaria domingensis]